MTSADQENGFGTVAVVGAGVMGETLLAGMLRAGWNPTELAIAEKRADRAEQLRALHEVAVLTPVEAAQWADTLVLAVKPQDIGAVLAELRPHLRAAGPDRVAGQDPAQLVVSVAAGITIAFLEDRLPPDTPVIRVMPNTAALVGQGMAAISPGTHCQATHLATARRLLSATGAVLEVPEYQQDAVTAVSGSGPAYVFYVVEAMIEGGVLLGLPRTTSTELVIQTLYGAATMLRDSGEHPTKLREQVSSPAGTTIQAIRELDSAGVRAAFLSALEAARNRSRDLSSGTI